MKIVGVFSQVVPFARHPSLTETQAIVSFEPNWFERVILRKQPYKRTYKGEGTVWRNTVTGKVVRDYDLIDELARHEWMMYDRENAG